MTEQQATELLNYVRLVVFLAIVALTLYFTRPCRQAWHCPCRYRYTFGNQFSEEKTDEV